MLKIYIFPLLLALLLPTHLLSSASAQEYAPFFPGFSNNFDRDELAIFNLDIFRRGDSKCGTSCSSMGANVCCGKKASCALDQAGNVACCPNGAACTGTISAPPAGDITSGPTTGVAAAAAMGTTAPTAAPSAAISHAISGTSTVANSYYPFPVLPTTFANAGDCSSSFSGCQAESAKCTGFVEGGGYGVTVDGGSGGGVTQQGVIAPASAEAICSSLSAAACHGLQLGMCSTLGGGGAQTSEPPGQSFVVGGSSAAAAATNGLRNFGVGVGVVLGVAGQMLR